MAINNDITDIFFKKKKLYFLYIDQKKKNNFNQHQRFVFLFEKNIFNSYLFFY